ncbi:MAG: hypothetical protein WAK20_17090 [Candidatus Acidiferrum sp.]
MKNEISLNAILREMVARHQPQLPNASLIWWRAQIARKLREKERIERPLQVMRVTAAIACAVMLSMLSTHIWGQLQALILENKWLLLSLYLLTGSRVVGLLVSSRAKIDRFPFRWTSIPG